MRPQLLRLEQTQEDVPLKQYRLLCTFVLAIYNLLCATTLVRADIGMGGDTMDDTISIIYVASTGEIALDAAGRELSGIQIVSTGEVFDSLGPATNVDGLFDINPIADSRPDTIAKAVFGTSFGNLSFGNVARLGLSEPFLRDDLTVNGSLFPSGEFGPGDVDLLFVPEPRSVALLLVGMLSVAGQYRRRCLS